MNDDKEAAKEAAHQEVDDLARQLLDCCNMRNAVTALTALSAAFHHLAHEVLHGAAFGEHSPERVVQACFNEGVVHAQLLDETRDTTVVKEYRA